jgi:hypothetical protein
MTRATNKSSFEVHPFSHLKYINAPNEPKPREGLSWAISPS